MTRETTLINWYGENPITDPVPHDRPHAHRCTSPSCCDGPCASPAVRLNLAGWGAEGRRREREQMFQEIEIEDETERRERMQRAAAGVKRRKRKQT